jgi:hypothetical protein
MGTKPRTHRPLGNIQELSYGTQLGHFIVLSLTWHLAIPPHH